MKIMIITMNQKVVQVIVINHNNLYKYILTKITYNEFFYNYNIYKYKII
jgi:hypothetical protein